MKNQIFITIWVLMLAVSVFFAISNITVSQTQYQEQTQQQIQRNDNIQLTIVDTSQKIKDIYWETTNFNNLDKMEKFINSELNFFQVRESKLSSSGVGNANNHFLIYPAVIKESKAYTNSNKNYNTNRNEVKIDVFGRFK